MHCKVAKGEHTEMSKTADGKDNYQIGRESPFERVQSNWRGISESSKMAGGNPKFASGYQRDAAEQQ